MIILITGRAGSGKSRLAAELSKHIKDFCIIKMADPLYAIHSSVFETLRSYGHTRPHGEINRDLLQDIGLWGRKQNPDFWLDIAKSRINRIFIENPNVTVCSEDIRFPNELNAFPNAFKIRLVASEECRIRRAQKLGNLNHISETALDHIPGDSFHLMLDSEHCSVEENVEKCLGKLRLYSPSI
jgi:hypothetical protein